MSDDKREGTAPNGKAADERKESKTKRESSKPTVVNVIRSLKNKADYRGDGHGSGEFANLRHEIGANDEFFVERIEKHEGQRCEWHLAKYLSSRDVRNLAAIDCNVKQADRDRSKDVPDIGDDKQRNAERCVFE